jgi:hypothetical protein
MNFSAAGPKRGVRRFKSQAVVLPLVLAPYRAEKRGSEPGAWRDHVEDAMEDARQLGTGSRVVSQNGILLARFENAGKYLPKEDFGSGSRGARSS